MTDEGLLAASERDRAAFGEFYERTERALLGFFGAATRSADLAADLTAETFASALSSVARFDPRSRSSWSSAINNRAVGTFMTETH
jgi:RNA polymerase sigma-70 factor, ECF subfamily